MKQFKNMTYPYILWISIMIVVPMFMILMYAFTKHGNDVATFWFTFENFTRFFSDIIFINVLKQSLYIAIITTILCILLGYPAAYIIANAKEQNKVFLILLITFPTWINMLVRTYAWMGILQDNGILNNILSLFGLQTKLLHTDFAVILGMVYNFIPFMILQIHTSLTKMDKSLLEAASDLGADKLQCFKSDISSFITWCYKWYYISIFTSNVQFLYTKAIRRRTICFNWKCYRVSIFNSRQLEFWQCDFINYGYYYYDFYVHY